MVVRIKSQKSTNKDDTYQLRKSDEQHVRRGGASRGPGMSAPPARHDAAMDDSGEERLVLLFSFTKRQTNFAYPCYIL